MCHCPLVARSHIPDGLVLPQPWATLVHLLHTHTRLGPLNDSALAIRACAELRFPSVRASGDGVFLAALMAEGCSPAMPMYQGFLL